MQGYQSRFTCYDKLHMNISGVFMMYEINIEKQAFKSVEFKSTGNHDGQKILKTKFES